MKKICLTILLLFCFSFPANSDSLIKDFKIDGIGLGDSLLDSHSSEEIQKAIQNDWNTYDDKDDTYKQVSFVSKGNDYDYIDFFVKPTDPKFLTYHIAGRIDYNNDLSGCFANKELVINEFISMFGEYDRQDDDGVEFMQDPSGKSKSYTTYFYLNNGDVASIVCNSFSNELKEQYNLRDDFQVAIENQEFANWFYILY